VKPSAGDLPVEQAADSGRSARAKVAILGTVGLCVGALTALVVRWPIAPLVGWDLTAAGYAGWEWLTVRRMDAERTARQAVREDPSQPATDALLLLASVASLGAVALVIITAKSAGSAAQLAEVGLCIASVICSWSLVHTVFMLKYARLYYTGADGGVDFHGPDPPRYTDFAYLAFTVGMTFQVSDTDLTTSRMRVTALRHALLSYVFGAVILATTINLVAGMSK
jgi:uncharacterized membrane protein